MATSSKLVLIVLCLFLLGANSQKCDISSIAVEVTNTGKKVMNDFVFDVEIKNTCHCKVSNVHMWSIGFASSIPWDTQMFRRDGAHYIVNNGKVIASSQSVKFSYAWNRAFKMGPSTFQISC